MRLITVIAAACLITGCSHKFSYNNAYKFDYHTSHSAARDSVVAFEPEPLQAIDVTQVAASVAPVQMITPKAETPRKLVIKKIKEVREKSERPEPNPKLNWAGVLSFIFGLPSLIPYIGLAFAVFAIPFGVIGLKSERRVLSIIGICLGGLAFLWITIIILALVWG